MPRVKYNKEANSYCRKLKINMRNTTCTALVKYLKKVNELAKFKNELLGTLLYHA